MFSQASPFRTLIHQWGSDPGVWLIRCPHRGAHQHRLDVLRILETVSSKLFVITILSLIASMDIYVDHDEARTSLFTSWSGVTLWETASDLIHRGLAQPVIASDASALHWQCQSHQFTTNLVTCENFGTSGIRTHAVNDPPVYVSDYHITCVTP